MIDNGWHSSDYTNVNSWGFTEVHLFFESIINYEELKTISQFLMGFFIYRLYYFIICWFYSVEKARVL